MRQLIVSLLLVFAPCLTANADIWKWVDEDGNVHFGDTPAREYVASAKLVKYTPDKRSASTSSNDGSTTDRGKDIEPEEEGARQDAQAYYCNQAKEIYRSYVDAPRLYRTSEDGRREYLSDQEAAAARANAEASVAEWCN